MVCTAIRSCFGFVSDVGSDYRMVIDLGIGVLSRKCYRFRHVLTRRDV